MRTLPHGPMGNAPPEYGIDAQSVRVIKIPLDSAREKEPLHIGGSLWWIVDASSATANAEWFYREDQGDGIPVYDGQSIVGIPFARPLLTNSAQAGEWLKILYCHAPANGVYTL